MKKVFLLIIAISSNYIFSQNVILSRYDLLGGATFDNHVISGTSGKTLKYDEISGSPYIDKTFREAKIANDYQNALVRYNTFKDEIEFKNKEEILILPKDEKFKKVEIISPKQVLTLLNLEGEPSGYYFELASGKYSLYKKIKTNFIDAKPASTPYGSDQPASFSTSTPIYYIVSNDKVIKKPKTQKQITETFVEKKEVLNSFFKENKIKFDKEEDLKKLVTFLNEN